MLILTRKPGESVYIGDNVKITIVEIKGHQIRIGIDAPKDLRIYREEIWLQILEENKRAAQSSETTDEDLENLSQVWGGRKGASTGISPKIAALGTVRPAKKPEGTDPQVVVKKKKKSEDS